jgi:hypothetical protein
MIGIRGQSSLSIKPGTGFANEQHKNVEIAKQDKTNVSDYNDFLTDVEYL